MKKIILSIIIFCLFNINANSHVDHYKEFNYLEYDLFRNNKFIGSHKYNFIRDSENLIVKSIVNFKITKFGVDLYTYSAESQEIYKKGNFQKFSSNTNQNKKIKYVKITLGEQQKDLIVDGSSFKGRTLKENIVGTWWNHEIVKAKAQISAISGRVIAQKVTFLGKEKILIKDKEYEALRFNFSSSDKDLPDNKKLNTDIWYDAKTNLWLKAAFDKKGYWEYRIKEFK